MDRIQKFVYINLDKRTDRNESILKELKKFNIPEEKIIRVSAIESEKGAYGCAMSHAKALELFRDSGDELWCFLEDDHYFTQSRQETDKIVDAFLNNKSYDVFLGCFYAIKGRELTDGIFRRTFKSCMASFYIVKKHVAEALLASHRQSAKTLHPSLGKNEGVPCDMMWGHLMKIFVFVAPYKQYGAQLISYSNIRNRNVDYSNFIKMKIDRKLDNPIEK